MRRRVAGAPVIVEGDWLFRRDHAKQRPQNLCVAVAIGRDRVSDGHHGADLATMWSLELADGFLRTWFVEKICRYALTRCKRLIRISRELCRRDVEHGCGSFHRNIDRQRR